VHVKARVASQPVPAQELQELAAAMPSMQIADDGAGGDVQGGEQRGRAMALVVVSASLGNAWGQGQQGLRAVQRLDLALLVNAQHHGHQRRVQVQPDDVTHLLDEQWVAGEIEGLLPVRLQPEGAPDSRHSGLRQAGLARHRARAPVRGSLGHALQRLGNHCVHASVVNRARGAGSRSIEQSVQPMLDEPSTLLRYGLRRDTLSTGNYLVVDA
jgi:hypothetical protein